MIEELIIFIKIKEGNVKAYESLFYKYYTPLCKYVTLLIGSYDDVEEIVQELFYKLWRDRDEISIKYSIKSYLYRSAHNMALGYCEHADVRQRYIQNYSESNQDYSFSVDSELECSELKKILDNVLRKLPERCKKIFLMNRFQGKKYKDIAIELSLSIKTVESDISKALKIIKEEVECYGK